MAEYEMFRARTTTTYRMALVTGASSGIGRAFAEALPASTGLLLVARDRVRLDEVSAGLASPGRTIATLPADLTTDRGREAVIERARQIGVDLLINNAGRGRLGRLLDHEPEDARATVELNVVTPLVLIRALLPGMLERARRENRRAGLIIVSSSTAFAPGPYFATYAASKAFDLVLAESLAEELRGEPVDVLALCPGATRSEFGRRAGFALGNLPGAATPRAVAEEALAALGRHTVLVSGRLRRAAYAPVILPRAIAARALGLAIGLFDRVQPPEDRFGEAGASADARKRAASRPRARSPSRATPARRPASRSSS
jgi:short-subunit dehydrogenase